MPPDETIAGGKRRIDDPDAYEYDYDYTEIVDSEGTAIRSRGSLS